MGIIKKVWKNTENDRYVRKLYKEDRIEIQEIEIETVNRCNGICPFCPVNVNEPQREYAKMTEELFHKIIDELSEMNYSGKLSLYSNNEPFLDSRIIDFHEYARMKVPNAYISLFTNGSFLTVDKFKKIIPFLDHMTIDNYNDSKVVNDGLQDVFELIESSEEYKQKVKFDIRLQNEVRFSRGGQAPNKKKADKVFQICLLPFRQFVIRPTGEVSLCCNDALGKYTMGNVNEHSIREIWKSEKYENVRIQMKKYRRKKMMLCENCDTRTAP